ncbi:DUF2599 domain-containing protein [Cellulosimicrobium composti]|uniref:DUF2599 domain-containing protein n=1 Tax=Cellulosimicrobium composti TaxID=2672572 RepID=UPI0037A39427
MQTGAAVDAGRAPRRRSAATARRRSAATTRRRLVVGVLLPLALVACTPGDDASPVAPAPATTRSDEASDAGRTSGAGDPSGAQDPAEGAEGAAKTGVVRVPVGPATVEVAVPPLPPGAPSGSGPAAAVTAGDEGASDVTLVLADGPARISVEGGSLVRHADGTLTVLDDAGTPVGGLGAPRVIAPHADGPGTGAPVASGTDGPGDVTDRDDDASDGTDRDDGADAGANGDGGPEDDPSATPSVRTALVDARHAEVTLVPTAGTPSAWDVVVPLGTQALRSTGWGEREGGRSLAVDPTAWARTAGQAGRELVWAQVVAAEPEADSPTMRDQLVCHAVGAPGKATWNLEPWRPDVGLLDTMAARCNPT